VAPQYLLDMQDAAGDTLLHLAASYGRTEAARVLVEARAKTDVCNKRGKRPVDEVRVFCVRNRRVVAARPSPHAL
jgi:ankyrin repeat protein